MEIIINEPSVEEQAAREIIEEPMTPNDFGGSRTVAAADAEADDAEAEIAAYEATRGARIVTMIVGDRECCIKRLEWSEIAEVALLTSRDTGGALDIRQPDVLPSFMVAMLEVAVAKSEQDESPRYAREQAQRLIRAAPPSVVGEWFDKITSINPGLLPQGIRINPTGARGAAPESAASPSPAL